jgi:hypothetical protein
LDRPGYRRLPASQAQAKTSNANVLEIDLDKSGTVSVEECLGACTQFVAKSKLVSGVSA